MNGVTVRPATAGDADALVERNVLLAAESEGRALDPGVVARGVRLLLSDPDRGRYWIAEADGAPRGSCLVTTEWSDWTNGRYWWLQSVYVDPEWRRRGVFRALWEAVVAEARAAGDVASIRLYVLAGNAAGRATYEGVGMEDTGYLVYEREIDR